MARKKRNTAPPATRPHAPPSQSNTTAELSSNMLPALSGLTVRDVVQISLALREHPYSDVPIQHWSDQDWARLEEVVGR